MKKKMMNYLSPEFNLFRLSMTDIIALSGQETNQDATGEDIYSNLTAGVDGGTSGEAGK